MRLALLVLSFSVVLAARSAYVPERVFDTSHKAFTDFEMMLAAVAKADVLFVGEEHDDPNTHELELALLEGLARRRPGKLAVGFEMFERDVQEPLDHFQMGHMDEAEFLKESRPWANYARDYKPLVDFAIKEDWPVFASNVPREVAADVSQSGLGALKARTGEATKWFAGDLSCATSGDYFNRFAEAMGDHPDKTKTASPDKAAARLRLERYYESQCLKDETMGESVARAYQAAVALGAKDPLVVHFNGAFHTDFAEGTAARAMRRLPGKRVVVITILPVDTLDTISPDKTDRKRADYLVYTLKGKK